MYYIYIVYTLYIYIYIYSFLSIYLSIYLYSVDVKIYWKFLQSIFVLSKMSETDKPKWRNVRKQQFQNEEGQLSEQFLIYKNQRSRYISELTKLINKTKTCSEKTQNKRLQ